MQVQIASIVTLLLYFSIILLLGFWAYRRTQSHSDYVLGGRKLGPVVTALGAGASDMSSWLMLALPGAIFLKGFGALWLPVGLTLGALINWIVVAGKLREVTEIYQTLTIPAFLKARFRDDKNRLQLVTALVILLFFTLYSASGFVAGATLFTEIFHLDYTTALLFSAPILIIYTSIGGFLAVNWVDVFQGFLMLFALLLLPIVALSHLGGFDSFLTLINTQNPTHFSFSNSVSSLEILSFLGWGLGYFGQLHILVRFMAAENLNAIKVARPICMTWMVVSLAGAVCVGLVGVTLLPELNEPETIMLALARQLLNPWFAGILFAAVLSSIMSTIAAQLLLCASAVVEDGYHSIINPNAEEKTLVWLERVVVVFVALCAILIASQPQTHILTLVGHAWAGLGASFGPVILGALFYPKMNFWGATCGMIVGAVVVIAWLCLGSLFPEAQLFQLYEIFPAFFLSLSAIYLGTQLSSSADNLN